MFEMTDIRRSGLTQRAFKIAQFLAITS